MGLVEAIVQGSSLFQGEREKAAAAGEAREARRMLRLALAQRFPGLETMPEIDRISETGDLENIMLRQVFGSTDRASVELAIVSAAERLS